MAFTPRLMLLHDEWVTNTTYQQSPAVAVAVKAGYENLENLEAWLAVRDSVFSC